MFALAGCSGRAHDAQMQTSSVQVAEVESPGATPFGVMPSGAPAAALPVTASAAPAATGTPAASSASPAAANASPSGATSAPAPVAPASSAAAPVASAAPQILSVHTSPAVVHDGDTLLWTVRTTPDVVDVVAHVTLYAFRLQKQATGQYVLTFTIPHGVPGFFHGNYTLDLVARSATGAEASTKVPVAFQ